MSIAAAVDDCELVLAGGESAPDSAWVSFRLLIKDGIDDQVHN